MKVDFYHLNFTPLERALPQVAEKVLASGNRLLIVAGGDKQRAALDRLLWSYAPDSFLPHAPAGAEDDRGQAVLISGEVIAANGARHVALVDGIWREAALTFERAFHFFDDDSIEAARAAWRELQAREGVDRRYWKQNEAGRWEQVA
ncbi:DNA polymerase III subunit chi [Sphingomonas sp. TX0543]|uniref:DNA polymerase III subunit chi n=1 Tax=unclassified Sphingomonas TaxID=196159 RepID=UPI0010F8CF2D|nr:DNA polymerase III subunit chi [Sphingomonas sp. 3P27F8]